MLFKTLTVARLKELLNELDDELFLRPNEVGNIAIYRDEKGRYFDGWIDFIGEGEIENPYPFEEES